MSPLLLLIASLAVPPTPEERAVAALAPAVQAWRTENRCSSCHHNADATRALYRAAAAGLKVSDDALAETTAWLAKPAGWANNGGEGPFNDKDLATLQFAHAVAVAVELGRVKERAPLVEAGKRVAALQQADGSWKADDDETPGTPATHGRPLATSLAIRTLRAADAAGYTEAIRKAQGWLRKAKVENVYQAAAVLLGLGRDDDEPARKQREVCLEVIRSGEARDGGWGPYARVPTEPFDTALVLLALAGLEPTDDRRAMIRRGRAALASWQEEDGTWKPTTRPAGAESNAQRTATTAWALQALLATR